MLVTITNEKRSYEISNKKKYTGGIEQKIVIEHSKVNK